MSWAVYFSFISQTGKIICGLDGHKRAITTSIVIKKYLDLSERFSDVIVTASSDETIKVESSFFSV